MSDDNFVTVDIESKKFDNKVIFSKLKFSAKEGEIISIFGQRMRKNHPVEDDCWIRGI